MTIGSHPRRIAHHPPLGSMLKRAGVPVVARPVDVAERDASYLAMVRQCPCLKCGMEPSQAAHVRYASAAFGKSSGMQKKPQDRFSVPLCAECHLLARDAQHKRNEREFWESFDINPLAVAAKLYEKRGDLLAMQMVVMVAIAERRK